MTEQHFNMDVVDFSGPAISIIGHHECHRCGLVLKSVKLLIAHLAEAHEGDFRFRCKFCKQGFNRTVKLRDHLRKHKVDEKYKCDICGKFLCTAYSLKSHQKTHATTVELPKSVTKCRYCDQECNSISQLRKHVANHKPIKCSTCNAIFSKVSEYRGHMPCDFQSDCQPVVNIDNVAEDSSALSPKISDNLRSSHGDIVVESKLKEFLKDPKLDSSKERKASALKEKIDLNHPLRSDIEDNIIVRERDADQVQICKKAISPDNKLMKLTVEGCDISTSNLDQSRLHENAEVSGMPTLLTLGIQMKCNSSQSGNSNLPRPVVLSNSQIEAKGSTGNEEIPQHENDIQVTDIFLVNKIIQEDQQEEMSFGKTGPSPARETGRAEVDITNEEDPESNASTGCPKNVHAICESTHHRTFHGATKRELNNNACHICGVGLKNVKLLIQHLAAEHGDYRFRCDFCNKGFSRPAALKNHMQSHRNEDKKMEEASEVEENCISTQRLRGSHPEEIIAKPIQAIPNNIVKEGSSTSFIPIEASLGTGNSCEDQKRTKPKCHVCGVTLKNVTLLTNHLKVSHGEHRFKCKFCGKGFSRSVKLKIHMVYHTGESDFKCDICQKVLSRADALRQHLKMHEKRDCKKGKKSLRCQICTQRFILKLSLMQHMRSHHKQTHFKVKRHGTHKSGTDSCFIEESAVNSLNEKTETAPSSAVRRSLRIKKSWEEGNTTSDSDKTSDDEDPLATGDTDRETPEFVAIDSAIDSQEPVTCMKATESNEIIFRIRTRSAQSRASNTGKLKRTSVQMNQKSTSNITHEPPEKLGPVSLEVKSVSPDILPSQKQQIAKISTSRKGMRNASKQKKGKMNRTNRCKSLSLAQKRKTHNSPVKIPKPSRGNTTQEEDSNIEFQANSMSNFDDASLVSGTRRTGWLKQMYRFCSKCDKTFDASKEHRTHMRDHINEHLENEGIIFNSDERFCHVCKHHFRRNDELINHLIQEHLEIHQFKCKHCSISFKSRTAACLHAKHDSCQHKLFVCNVCKLSLKNLEDLKKHVEEHADEYPFSCEFCPRRFKKAYLSKYHMHSHTKTSDGKSYKCSLCEFAVTSQDALRKHLLSHKKGVVYPCSVCRIELPSSRQQRLHEKSHKVKDPPNKCNECNKEFASRAELRYHLSEHQGLSYFQCISCEASFFRPFDLKKHMKVEGHNGDESAKCRCSKCQKTFSLVENLRGHVRSHETNKNYLCSICGKAFTLPKYLSKHLRVMHQDDSKRKDDTLLGIEKIEHERTPFRCAFCKKMYTRKHTLKLHIKTHLGRGDYKCSTCDREFHSQAVLKRHSRIHTDLRPHKCPICEKTFRDKAHLLTHMQVHSDERPYECNVCGYKFKQVSAFNRHKRLHTDVTKYLCSICGGLFSTKVHLKNHLLIHMRAKPHACGLCGRTFRLKATLKLHSLTHLAPGSFPCDLCGKTFKRAHLLNHHRKRHKTYTCSICGDGLTDPRSLRVHMKGHEGIQLHSCTICGKQFFREDMLNFHMKGHVSARPYQCSYCSKRFIKQKDLDIHTLTHSEPRFGCEVCGRRFRLEVSLKKHMDKIHSEGNQATETVPQDVVNEEVVAQTAAQLLEDLVTTHDINTEPVEVRGSEPISTVVEEQPDGVSANEAITTVVEEQVVEDQNAEEQVIIVESGNFRYTCKGTLDDILQSQSVDLHVLHAEPIEDTPPAEDPLTEIPAETTDQQLPTFVIPEGEVLEQVEYYLETLTYHLFSRVKIKIHALSVQA